MRLRECDDIQEERWSNEKLSTHDGIILHSNAHSSLCFCMEENGKHSGSPLPSNALFTVHSTNVLYCLKSTPPPHAPHMHSSQHTFIACYNVLTTYVTTTMASYPAIRDGFPTGKTTTTQFMLGKTTNNHNSEKFYVVRVNFRCSLCNL